MFVMHPPPPFQRETKGKRRGCREVRQGCIVRGAGSPPPPPSRVPSLRPATVPVSFNGTCN